jgi:alginate O-acetyltransferase complex protein AlgI
VHKNACPGVAPTRDASHQAVAGMLFNSIVFIFGFLPVCYTVFWALRTADARYRWLTLTGYVFYGYWNAKFCILMAFSTVVSYSAGLGFLRWEDPRRRRLCLIIPITVDLLLLGFFKYANFGITSVTHLVDALGGNLRLPHLDIILPIGISFYTFHTISYIVDGYRRTIRPTRNFFEFAAYVSLFSQLVAGPIVRFRQIEGDLQALGRRDWQNWLGIGLSFFCVGLVEKVLVADSLAAFVDPALTNYLALSTAGAWLAMLGYTFQLYFDFSGYSTMAVGLGYLFGLHIPQNFNSPYKALDPSDFWKRWHISLSTVLRDYLYIPLGGNRGGTFQTYRNLMLTMLLGGLWHGASWTFVAWGAYHGILLCCYRAAAAQWDRLPAVARRVAMFLLVVVGWVLFRATSFGMAWHLLVTMLTWVPGELPANTSLAIPLLLVAAWWSMIGPNAFDMQLSPRLRTRLVLAAGFGTALALIVSSRPSPFLYFQF